MSKAKHQMQTPRINRAARRGQTTENVRRRDHRHAGATVQANAIEKMRLDRARELQKLIDELDEADTATLLQRYSWNNRKS